MSFYIVKATTVEAMFAREISPYMLALGNRVLTAAQERCNTDTGALRASLRLDALGDTFRVGSDLPYALYVHEGTRPHVITPRRPGGYLRFTTARGVVFARRVRHPGYQGNPFLRDAMVAVVGSL